MRGMHRCVSKADLHRFGGMATSADSPKVQASVRRVDKLQPEGGALTQDGDPHSVQAVDVDWEHLAIHAGLAGAEGDAHVLACSRSEHTWGAVHSKAVGILIPEGQVARP